MLNLQLMGCNCIKMNSLLGSLVLSMVFDNFVDKVTYKVSKDYNFKPRFCNIESQVVIKRNPR